MITIRRATISDADTIAAFNSAMAIETENHHLDPNIVGPGTREGLADESKAIYFVAEIDQKIVGQIMITHEWSDWRNGDIWWIQSVYVAPDARRRGVFRAMYEHVQSRAKDAGAIGLRLYV